MHVLNVTLVSPGHKSGHGHAATLERTPELATARTGRCAWALLPYPILPPVPNKPYGFRCGRKAPWAEVCGRFKKGAAEMTTMRNIALFVDT